MTGTTTARTALASTSPLRKASTKRFAVSSATSDRRLPVEAAAIAAVAAVAVAAADAAVGPDVVADVPSGSEAVRTADPGIEKTLLPSGLRVVTERMPEAKSVAIGVWVGVGSRDESDELAGASHFLEHLLFKGTEARSARSIATAIDAAGGEMNAFTTRESTAFYTRLP